MNGNMKTHNMKTYEFFFRFFFNRLPDSLFNCEDHYFHFHILIHSSKYTKKLPNPFQPLSNHRPKSVLNLTPVNWSSSFNFTFLNGLYNYSWPKERESNGPFVGVLRSIGSDMSAQNATILE